MDIPAVERLQRQITRSLLKGVTNYDPKNDYNSMLIRDAAKCSICDEVMVEKPDEDIWTGPGETGLKANKQNGYTLVQRGWESSHAAYSTDPTTKMLHICAECMLDQANTFEIERIHDLELPGTPAVPLKDFAPCRVKWFVQSNYTRVYGNYFDEGIQNDFDLQLVESLVL